MRHTTPRKLQAGVIGRNFVGQIARSHDHAGLNTWPNEGVWMRSNAAVTLSGPKVSRRVLVRC
jgi:hypothetical protein